MFRGALSICGKRFHIGVLNGTVARLGYPASIDVDNICNKARLIPQLVSIHF